MAQHTVRQYMSPSPHTIGHDQTLATAHRFMRERRIRHLPVLQAGQLVGLLSQRDLYLLETFRDVDQNTVPVSEAMSPDPVTVTPDTPLKEAVHLMADQKLGSTVVTDEGGRVVGIFTAIDALKALEELLES